MTTPADDLPRLIESKTVFEGRVIGVSIDTLQEGDLQYQREIVHHNGSAVIVPVFADETVAFVRQYRHPAGRYLLEVPAGTLDKGESPEVGAARELEEELGFVADHLELLSEFYLSPGFLQEKMWVYLATEMTETRQRLDEDEILDVVRVPMVKALAMISSGEI